MTTTSTTNPGLDRLAPTDEQLKALGVRGASVALSAGAGCGKTFVLAERFVRALEGPESRPLSRVVALTFTNKAARELRERVRKECRVRLDAGGDPAHWRAILRGLTAVRISTFHSFCGEVLRQYAIEAEVDPGFTLLDESIAHAYRQEALDETLRERLAARDPDLIELAVEFGLGMVSRSIDDLLGNRSSGDLRDWVHRRPRDLVDAWLSRWTESIQPAMLAAFRERLRPCLDLIRSTAFENPKVASRLAEFQASVALLEIPGDPEAKLDGIKLAAKVVGLVGKLWPSAEVYEAIKSEFERIRDDAKKLAKNLPWDEPTTIQAAEQGLSLARLTFYAREAYDRAKQSRGVIDNDDLLTITRDLLDRRPDVREALANSVDLILVDEFQDTDPVQASILEHLAGSEVIDGSLFLVGDTKQSIYRFRKAQPELFQAYRDRFPADGQLALSENFRSVPAILAFVNALFADTFHEPNSALRAGGQSPEPQGPPAVEFLWGSSQVESAGDRPDVNARRKDEARRLARHLRTRLDDGWLIRDPTTKALRSANQGDIAFLFRSLSDAADYEQALVAEGFDYHVVGGSGYFAQQEVLDLINVLTVIEDPFDAVSLAGALRSPFFSISDDALYWIATERKGQPHVGLDRCQQGVVLDKLPELDRPRAVRARRLFEAWRSVKDRLPIATLVDRVLADSGYESALIGEFLGDRKRANARKLVRMARKFDAQGGFTLADFVDRLRSDLRSATKETQAATTDEQGEIIRLMSIHQAKGLEFPIVVVPDLDRKRPGELKRVAFDSALGPLVNPVLDVVEDEANDEPDSGGCLGWMIYRHLERQADDAEALRLFYVATTRARDALVLSSATDPEKPPGAPALTLLDRRFDRLTGLLKSPLPEGLSVPRIRVVSETKPTGSSRSPANRYRPRLLEVARMIQATPSDPDKTKPIVAALPSLVILDPTLGLTSTSSRLDRLIRTILDDPRSVEPAQVEAIASRAARLQNPVSPASLVAEAVDRFSRWVRFPLVREVVRSVKVNRGFAWSVAWPMDGSSSSTPTTFQGRGDLAYQQTDGSFCLIQFSHPDASEPREWLRLLLSVRAFERLGLGSISQGWWVRLGKVPTLAGFDRFDDSEIDRAIHAVFDRPQIPEG